MSPEHRHQIYGGDISDYIVPQKQKETQLPFLQTQDDLSNIYDRQIKGKPSIDTTGLVSSGNILPPFERDPHFQHIENNLKDTLNIIAQQIGLSDNDGVKTLRSGSVDLKDQTTDDLTAANNNVLKALEELKNLGAAS